ncbi:L-lactate dehydrogenase [Acetohalobium arabaticum]|uniref:L-lactate dehydrogenase n=1 Tax=Acetohalobium arabaticum (strain ATCC 49924 / DSM 5501 / Z-7288) TaxID=574087 RepID=D9QU51_ACEAZ|nr:L-lactate dehydrogenase [Acetohalobium arabaticum]ADL11844.1 L-lactate dehydrogenase [Acetohalobium arabaticum DSM 5501]
MVSEKEGVKIGIIGAGFVGSTTAFTVMMNGLASEIVLVDIDQDKAEGEAMDLRHGASFVSPVNIETGGYQECQDADIVIITAGASQEPGETRLDLTKRNVEIFKDMIPKLTAEINSDTLLLVVTNPVDILSYVTWKLSDLPARQVIGSGTVLDSSRFRYILSQRCDIDARNIHGYIIGEHGDSEVPVWSATNIVGVPFEEFDEVCNQKKNNDDKSELISKIKNVAYEIIDRKGATYYAIALAINRIVKGIIRDENSILTLSTLLQGEYGFSDVYLSLPCIINRNGIREILELELSPAEQEALNTSAEVLQDLIGGKLNI